MKTFKTFLKENNYYISEEIHQQLQDILDRYVDPKDSEKKFTEFTKTVKSLIQNQIDPGIDAKPKKGSSRAVFIPNEQKIITLDNQPTQAKTALKIAFPGRLDRFRIGDEPILGNMQNRMEADGYAQHAYGILRENNNGTYETNPEGILIPVYSHHPEHDYLEVGYAPKPTITQFRKLTKTSDFPKGLHPWDVSGTLINEWDDAHGKSRPRSAQPRNEEQHEKLMNHPFIQRIRDMMLETDMHPHDLHSANYGIWTHPLTNAQHLVITDYGYGSDVPKAYTERKMRSFQKR